MTEAESIVEPPTWSDPSPSRPIPFWKALGEDVLAHVPPEVRDRPWRVRVNRNVSIVLRSPGLHVVIGYRLGHSARYRLGPLGRFVAALLFWAVRHWYVCSIATSARLHGGLILPHPQGIVIGAGTVVGPRAWIYQNVTLGGSPGKIGAPTVGSDARIYSGAVLAGPIQVGDNVAVGANAVLLVDVPSRRLVRSLSIEAVDLPGRFQVEADR